MKKILLSSILSALTFASCLGQPVTISKAEWLQLLEKGALLEEMLQQCDSLYRFKQLKESLLQEKARFQTSKINLLSIEVSKAKGNVSICESNAVKREKTAIKKGRMQGAGFSFLLFVALLILL